MPSWFDSNPILNPTDSQRFRFNAHVWGRQQYAKSFAKGGFAATVFAQSPKEAFMTGIGMRSSREGSTAYIQNLRKLQALHPDSPAMQKGVNKALADVEKGAARGVMGTLGRGAMFGAMALMPAAMVEGPFRQTVPQRARAMATGGLGFFVGWEAGSKIGMGTGAAIGSAIGSAVLPVVGTAIGAGIGVVAGYVAGGLAGQIGVEQAAEAIMSIPDRMVGQERSRRRLNWAGNTQPFRTQRAYTMRQQSLQAMNRGQMSARSLLGQEAVFVHK